MKKEKNTWRGAKITMETHKKMPNESRRGVGVVEYTRHGRYFL
jgi:hypothetical protein